ncbi:kinase-like domain-containing protein [Aspergillus granulosus]|uniref:Kinase-like domain-containing protein n=1 Tax=Aspergillus granulosus TaxID=176169 RepID=A0ABR4GRM0_9EURO
MSSPFLDIHGDPIPQERILGNGASAVVLLQNDVAIKTPLRYRWSSESEVQANAQSLMHEQDVYRRLQNPRDDRSHGVVRCIGLSTDTTQLAYMANGDLRTYLAKFRPPRQLQLKWFKQMARTLSFIHDRRVLVADIASRNFLLDSDLSLKICDFTEASLLPLDCDMETVDDNGYTTQIDVGLLGAVMYEVITGNRCEIDLFRDNSPTDGRAYWPERRFLPSTRGIWLGWLIEGCWDGEISSAHSLLLALNSTDPRLSPISGSPNPHLLASIRNSLRELGYTTIVGVLGLVLFTLVVGRKAFSTSRNL